MSNLSQFFGGGYVQSGTFKIKSANSGVNNVYATILSITGSGNLLSIMGALAYDPHYQRCYYRITIDGGTAYQMINAYLGNDSANNAVSTHQFPLAGVRFNSSLLIEAKVFDAVKYFQVNVAYTQD